MLKGNTHNRNSNNLLLFCLPLSITAFALLSASILTAYHVSADDSVVDQVNVTVAASCTLSGTGMDSHNAEITNGTYRDNIGTTTLKAFCNDSEGFAIYAIGFTGDQYTGEDHTKLIGTNTNQKIVTGTNTSGTNTTPSNWAMKLTTNSSSAYPIELDNSYNNYNVVPDTYTKVAHRNSSTDVGTSATGAELTTTYAAYISSIQVADTYTGKVKYTLVHPASEEPLQPQPASPGKIVYHKNASDAIGTMADQSAGNNASVDLYPSNFSRAGYGFAGWSTTFDYSDETGLYGPMETITTPSDTTTNGLSLYAIWVKSAGNLQDWNGCSSLNQGDVTALTDTRDNDTYAVAKLADGKCWMIENLRLDNTNSDNSTGALAQGYNSSFIGLAEPEASWANNSTNANSLYTTETGVSGKQTITGDNIGYRLPRYNNQNISSRADTTTNSTNIYSYGNYYTWPAAIADTTEHNTNNQSVENTSICPKGWHLPKGGDKSNEVNNEFWSLVVTGLNNGTNPANYESSTQPYYTGNPEGNDVSKLVRAYPNNFVYSGYVFSGSVSNRGSYGYYRSSTVNSTYNAYSLYFTSSYVYPGTSYVGKYGGGSIRCVR